MIAIVFVWIFFGGLLGWIASLLNEKRSETLTFIYITVGASGALIGGLIAAQVFGTEMNEIFLSSLSVAVPVAVFMLGLYRFTSR